MKTILVDSINTFIIKGEGIFKNMYGLLEKYHNEKIILTNANDEEVKKYNLVNLPYKLFTLKHNPDKTNPKYFETLLKDFSLNNDDVLYFEHNPEAIKSAESIGIKSYFYNSKTKDLLRLQNFLEENGVYQKSKSFIVGDGGN